MAGTAYCLKSRSDARFFWGLEYKYIGKDLDGSAKLFEILTSVVWVAPLHVALVLSDK